jgi:hypothetical protein
MTTKTRRLHEVIAIEKGIKERTQQEMTKLQGALQHPDLFNGHQKQYQPKDDTGERFPDDVKRVQIRTFEVLERIAELRREVIDIEATKDLTNTVAKADIVLDGKTIAAGVPATTLLFLEKDLVNLLALINALPILDTAQEWHKDEASGLWRTPVQKTHKTSKTQRPIVLYDATDKHPAQTQLITEDVVAGYWQTVQISGGMPLNDKLTLWKKVNKLSDAVKSARERANSVDVAEMALGRAIFDYLFG